MLHFGRELGRRGPLDDSLAERLLADPSIMELLPLATLRVEAASLGAGALSLAKGHQGRAFLAQALVLQEISRRTGEVEALGRAAVAIRRAIDLSKGDRSSTALAMLHHASILALSATLFGDAEAASAAADRLDEVAAQSRDPVTLARLNARRAQLLAREVYGVQGSVVDQAASGLDAAARALASLAKVGKLSDCEAHGVRCDKVELLIGCGLRSKDRRKIDQALTELRVFSKALDPNYRPLTWARAETLRGQALAALGDLCGDAASIAEGTAALTRVSVETAFDHSLMDAARAGHALGLAFQSLGEACDEERLFDRAIDAYAPALEAVELSPLLSFRAVVAHDAAVCLARRAERRGDLASLELAEIAFRTTLRTRSAAADPVSWAVTQMALARIYEAKADMRGDAGERAHAAFAVASALDVFSERGLRSLSDMALSALARLKPTA